MMQRIFLLALFTLSLSLNGQSLKFKNTLEASTHKRIDLIAEGFTVKLKGSAKKVVLVVKNTGEEALELDPDKIKLLDVAGRGEPLCGKTMTLRPGKKARWVLVPCDAHKGDGLFGLRYEQEAGFDKDVDASFIYDKEFQLLLGGERVQFYTSW